MNTNAATTAAPTLQKQGSATGYIGVFIVIAILTVITTCVFFDVPLVPHLTSVSSSQQQAIADLFIILFFCLLVVALIVLFLPSMKDIRDLFSQITPALYVIIYTIAAILVYTLTPTSVTQSPTYGGLLNLAMFLVGGFLFYRASTTSAHVAAFSVPYARIQQLLVFFCFLTLCIVVYDRNPGNIAALFGTKSLLLTILCAVFLFLYALLVLSGAGSGSNTSMFANMTNTGVYGSIGFVIFLVISTILMSVYHSTLFANQDKTAAVFLLFLTICILWISALGLNYFSGAGTGTGTGASADSTTSPYMKAITMLFGLTVSGLCVYWVVYQLQHLTGGSSSIVGFILNTLLLLVLVGLIYKTAVVQLPSATGNAKKNAVFALLESTVLAIPCAISDGFTWLARRGVSEYHATTASSLLMLATACGLWGAYQFVNGGTGPRWLQGWMYPGSKSLVSTKEPLTLDQPHTLATYQELYPEFDKQEQAQAPDYRYAISCQVFLDTMAPNESPVVTRYATILDFGGKPFIRYHTQRRSLQVSMGDHVVYETDGPSSTFPLQRWNSIIINYTGGTLDIFINGTLVKSIPGEVPYYTYDTLIAGEQDGIHGGIRDVTYYTKELTANEIWWLTTTQ